MGLVMLALGTNLLLKGPRKGQAPSQSASQHPDLRAFSIGMGLMAPNFSSLVLFFPALAALTMGAPARSEEFLFIGLLELIMMSPCLIPLLLVGIAGRGGRALSSIASITGLNRSNGRWDCWCASPQPNTSSSAESWLLEQPGVAIRMRHMGEGCFKRPGPTVAPASRAWMHQREAIKTHPTIPTFLHLLGRQLLNQCPLSIAEPGPPGVGSACSRLKWRPKAGPWHPGNASNA